MNIFERTSGILTPFFGDFFSFFQRKKIRNLHYSWQRTQNNRKFQMNKQSALCTREIYKIWIVNLSPFYKFMLSRLSSSTPLLVIICASNWVIQFLISSLCSLLECRVPSARCTQKRLVRERNTALDFKVKKEKKMKSQIYVWLCGSGVNAEHRRALSHSQHSCPARAPAKISTPQFELLLLLLSSFSHVIYSLL